MGLEGLVSKRRDRPYRGGRSPHWNVKNPASPAMHRARDAFRERPNSGTRTLKLGEGTSAAHGA